MSMNRNLDLGDPLHASFFDSLMEFIGPALPDLRFKVGPGVLGPGVNSTTTPEVIIPSVLEEGAGITGLWRYAAAGEASTPMSLATSGDRDIFAVCSANEIDPVTFADTTDYAWYLDVRSVGVNPSGFTPAGKAISNYRKIARVRWTTVAPFPSGVTLPASSANAETGILLGIWKDYGTEFESFFGEWRTIHTWFTNIDAIVPTGGMKSEHRQGGSSSTIYQGDVVWLDPADYPGGHPPRIRMRCHMDSNGQGVPGPSEMHFYLPGAASNVGTDAYTLAGSSINAGIYASLTANNSGIVSVSKVAPMPGPGLFRCQYERSGSPSSGWRAQARVDLQVRQGFGGEVWTAP